MVRSSSSNLFASVAMIGSPVYASPGAASQTRFRIGRLWQSSISKSSTAVVRRNKRVFGITADHVVAQLLRDYDEMDPKPLVYLSSTRLSNVSVLGRSGIMDLATLNLEDVLKGVDCSLLDLPPRLPAEVHSLMWAGYPSSYKEFAGPRNIRWNLCSSIGLANTVSMDQITSKIVKGPTVIDQMLPNSDLGGISGGPMVAYFHDDIVSWRICGIVTEARAYDSDEILHYIVGSTVDSISDSGNIR